MGRRPLPPTDDDAASAPATPTPPATAAAAVAERPTAMDPLLARRRRNPLERFDARAEFVWSRSLKMGEEMTTVGAAVDKDRLPPGKLLMLWRSHYVRRLDGGTRLLPR